MRIEAVGSLEKLLRQDDEHLQLQLAVRRQKRRRQDVDENANHLFGEIPDGRSGLLQQGPEHEEPERGGRPGLALGPHEFEEWRHLVAEQLDKPVLGVDVRQRRRREVGQET